MDVFGISIITLILGLFGGAFMGLKWLAPKTDARWDDSIIDVVEGAAEVLGVDPDELAKRSLGRLKRKVLK